MRLAGNGHQSTPETDRKKDFSTMPVLIRRRLEQFFLVFVTDRRDPLNALLIETKVESGDVPNQTWNL